MYRPRYGPEWGSGGVFGLTYYKGVLYYTLAMEAESHFILRDHELVYRFQQLGPGPASGGDTYNAVETVDDEIYFGGWVHNPAVYKGKAGFAGEIDFSNKYSHVHVFDTRNYSVKLVWSDTIRHEREWAGEVSQIIYDHVEDKLLLGRADGMRNLGIYLLDRGKGFAERISDIPGLKGSLFLEYACFDMQPNWFIGVEGIQCYGLHERKFFQYRVGDWTKISVDGYPSEYRGSGYAVSAYSRYWHFMKSGVLVGNPVEPEIDEPRYVRLFDFGLNPYAPQRSNALEMGGGILASFNAYSHGYLHPYKWDNEEKEKIRRVNTIVGPSVLVYITPPTARIVLALGARVTSMTKMGKYLLLGVNNMPNLGGRDSTLIDVGTREIIKIPESQIISGRSPPVVFKVPGYLVGDRAFGGIPLAGYREKLLKIVARKPNRLKLVEYDIGLPPSTIEEAVFDIREGVNIIELSGYKNIVSFKYEYADNDQVTYITLE